MSFDVPILLCVFNRPMLTAQVIAAIAHRKPKRLLIAGDGPRPDRPEDPVLVHQTRTLIDRIDWDCDIQTRFCETNLGCRQHVASAITWGFEQSERLIILEDDCVPNQSFFEFTRELLERYSSQPEVMLVSGNSYPTSGYGEYSYRFSKYPLIWGWASWRRAWNLYDLQMKSWRIPEVQIQVLDQFTDCSLERQFWKNIFNHQCNGQINTWDYSWTFTCWANNGLSILPRHNLVTNIGFGDDATHTFDPTSPMANRTTHRLEITNHPPTITRDKEADQEICKIVFEPETIPMKPRKSWVDRIINVSRSPIFSRKTYSLKQDQSGRKAA